MTRSNGRSFFFHHRSQRSDQRVAAVVGVVSVFFFFFRVVGVVCGDGVRADGFAKGGVLRRAHARDEPGAPRAQDLHGEVPDAAARAENEHVLPRGEAVLVQELRDGDAGKHQRRGFLVRQAARFRRYLVQGDGNQLRERASERRDRAVHLVPDREAAPRGRVLDDAGQVEARDLAIPSPRANPR